MASPEAVTDDTDFAKIPLQNQNENLIPALDPEHNALFAEIASEHMDALHAYAMRLTGNEYDADDLVQETFIKMMLSFSQFEDRDGEGIRPWLWTIARTRHIDHIRKNKREKAASSDMTDEAALTRRVTLKDLSDETVNPRKVAVSPLWMQGTADPEQTAVEKLGAQRRIDEVVTALEAKTGRKEFVTSALVCLLMLDEGYSREEIAPFVGVAVSTVSTQKSRILGHIRSVAGAELISA